MAKSSSKLRKYYCIISTTESVNFENRKDTVKSVFCSINKKENDIQILPNGCNQYDKNYKGYTHLLKENKIGFQFQCYKYLGIQDITEVLNKVIEELSVEIKIKKSAFEPQLLFKKSHSLETGGEGDILGIMENDFWEKNVIEKDYYSLLRSSIFEFKNEVITNKDSLELVCQASISYISLEPEKFEKNKTIYSLIGNTSDSKYFDMSSSIFSILNYVLSELGIATGLNLTITDAICNEEIQKIDRPSVLKLCNIMENIEGVKFGNNVPEERQGGIIESVKALLNSKELNETATLYYSIGNYIPVIDNNANAKKAKVCQDIFDVYYIEDEETLKSYYTNYEEKYCMHMDYYKVIKNSSYLEKIVKKSVKKVKIQDVNCEGGTYNIASILELYNFFNLRIKLRSAWICAVLAENSIVNAKNKERVVQKFVNIAKQYEDELHKCIAILDCFAGESERNLTRINFDYLTKNG